MKSNIRHTLIYLLFALPFLLVATVGLVLFSLRGEWHGVLIASGMILVGIGVLCAFLYFTQWFEIQDRVLIVKCIFGKIKEIRLRQIQKALTAKGIVGRVNRRPVYRSFIVISPNTSIQKWMEVEAYNTKQSEYIVLPDTPDIRAWLCEEYRKASGEALIIK